MEPGSEGVVEPLKLESKRQVQPDPQQSCSSTDIHEKQTVASEAFRDGVASTYASSPQGMPAQAISSAPNEAASSGNVEGYQSPGPEAVNGSACSGTCPEAPQCHPPHFKSTKPSPSTVTHEPREAQSIKSEPEARSFEVATSIFEDQPTRPGHFELCGQGLPEEASVALANLGPAEVVDNKSTHGNKKKRRGPSEGLGQVDDQRHHVKIGDSSSDIHAITLRSAYIAREIGRSDNGLKGPHQIPNSQQGSASSPLSIIYSTHWFNPRNEPTLVPPPMLKLAGPSLGCLGPLACGSSPSSPDVPVLGAWRLVLGPPQAVLKESDEQPKDATDPLLEVSKNLHVESVPGEPVFLKGTPPTF